MRNFFGVSTLLLGAILVPVLRADHVTYYLNDPVGGGGITGTITTDGKTTGTLSIGDIVAWNLTVSDGTNTVSLNVGDSTGYVSGSDLSATATQLLFNFDDSAGGYLFFQDPHSGENGPYACFISNTPNDCYETHAIVLDPTFNTDSSGNPSVLMSGTQVVIGSVPEPGTVRLLCLEFAALLAIFRRRMVGGRASKIS